MKTIIITPESQGVRPYIKKDWYVWIGGKYKEPTNVKFADGMNIYFSEIEGIDTFGGDIILSNNCIEVRSSHVYTRGGSVKMDGCSHFRLDKSQIYLHAGKIDMGGGWGEVSMRDSCIFAACARIEVRTNIDGGFVNVSGGIIGGQST